ncbi:MAG: hypothetical protein ABEH35_00745 [Haloarculaceae archaeon]
MAPIRGEVWTRLRSLSFTGVEAILVVAVPFALVGAVAVGAVAADATSPVVRWPALALAVALVLEPAVLALVLIAHSLFSLRRGLDAGDLLPATALGWLGAGWRGFETVVAVGYLLALLLAAFGAGLTATADVNSEAAGMPLFAGMVVAVTATIVLVTVVSVRLVATGLYKIAQ